MNKTVLSVNILNEEYCKDNDGKLEQTHFDYPDSRGKCKKGSCCYDNLLTSTDFLTTSGQKKQTLN